MLDFTSARQRNFFNYIFLLRPGKVQLHYFGTKKNRKVISLTMWYNGPYIKKKNRKTNLI